LVKNGFNKSVKWCNHYGQADSGSKSFFELVKMQSKKRQGQTSEAVVRIRFRGCQRFNLLWRCKTNAAPLQPQTNLTSFSVSSNDCFYPGTLGIQDVYSKKSMMA